MYIFYIIFKYVNISRYVTRCLPIGYLFETEQEMSKNKIFRQYCLKIIEKINKKKNITKNQILRTFLRWRTYIRMPA